MKRKSDLVDLDRVGELDEWWYVLGGVLLWMCVCEVGLSLSAGNRDAVAWLKSQLKRVGSSFSGEYDFRCLESLSCWDGSVMSPLSEWECQYFSGIFLRSRCVLKDSLSLSFSRSCSRRDGL